MQKAVVPEALPIDAALADRFRNLVLVRIACALRGATKGEVAADLAPVVSSFASPPWRAEVERVIEALAAAGLVTGTSARRQASDAGKVQAGKFLGIKGDLPHIWGELRDTHLVAVALGMKTLPANRIKPLRTLDGLRGAVVERAFNLKLKGVPTPARLREALAATALKRAFRDNSAAHLAGKLGLSAKAGRLLAAQLSAKPRDFGTDTRLIAALAAEDLGCEAADLDALRLALLRRYFAAAMPAKTAPAKRQRVLGKGAPAKINSAPPPVAPRVQSAAAANAPGIAPPPATAVPAPPAPGRPDLPGFASEVRRHAASQAQGWSGDRKAYISHVWRNIRDKRPEWGLSEIEFKCMLAEAHRAGQLALANADLKDKDNIKDVQDSAVSFRNAVFHFIRVDA